MPKFPTYKLKYPKNRETENISRHCTARRSRYVEGAQAMAPVLIGIIPMAIVTGVAAVNSGMTQWKALISSVLMYAAAAQLVAYEMLRNGASAFLIFMAAIILNLRLVLYSAGIATHLQSLNPLTFDTSFGSIYLNRSSLRSNNCALSEGRKNKHGSVLFGRSSSDVVGLSIICLYRNNAW